jgi:hypothetical protein
MRKEREKGEEKREGRGGENETGRTDKKTDGMKKPRREKLRIREIRIVVKKSHHDIKLEK